jgi:hypothetical protein
MAGWVTEVCTSRTPVFGLWLGFKTTRPQSLQGIFVGVDDDGCVPDRWYHRLVGDEQMNARSRAMYPCDLACVLLRKLEWLEVEELPEADTVGEPVSGDLEGHMVKAHARRLLLWTIRCGCRLPGGGG